MFRAVFCLNGPDAVNGPNVWLARHLPLLAGRGIEPVVLYLSWKPEQPCRFRQALAAAGVAVHSVALGRVIEDNVVAIAAAARALAPDVFVPNYSVAGYYAAGLLRTMGVITVGTLHSDDPNYHDILEVFADGEPRWRLSALVGVSDFLRTLVSDKLRGRVPFLHAPYGAPVSARQAEWSADRFRLVYCGRLVEPQKRVHRVAAAMQAATRCCPRVDGVLYGDGPERSRLTESLATGGGRVRLGGLLEPAAVQEAMADAQAFVLLSDFEGLSIALMEAMACGLVPVVTAMRSGVADLVTDGETGLVVQPDDAEGFAAAVARLADDAVLWRRLSAAARRAVVERGFTVEACADRWAEFLRRLVADRTKTPDLDGDLPVPDALDLPPRCTRPGGIRLEDRRAVRAMRRAQADGRPVYLWGASQAGEMLLDSLEPRGLPIAGLIDSDPRKHGRRLREISIFAPRHLTVLREERVNPYVVIASQFEEEIGATLVGLGFVEEKDFVAG